MLLTDYFLGSHVLVEDFMEAAKFQMFQLYCRLHSTASLEYVHHSPFGLNLCFVPCSDALLCGVLGVRFVAKMIGQDLEGAETWVVELIRSGQLRARINSVDKQVVVEPPQSRVYAALASMLLHCSSLFVMETLRTWLSVSLQTPNRGREDTKHAVSRHIRVEPPWLRRIQVQVTSFRFVQRRFRCGCEATTMNGANYKCGVQF